MENKLNITFYKTIRNILKVPIKLIFNPKILGIENIPEKPYIIVGNHKSLWDIPAISMCVRDEIHFMAKKELFNSKISSYIFTRLGAFPIDREILDINAIKTSLSILKEGKILGIFPEGTRNKTSNVILPFKKGVTKIAKKTNALIVPFGISGKYKFKSNLTINIGEPIDMNLVKVEDENEYLEEKVKRLIL